MKVMNPPIKRTMTRRANLDDISKFEMNLNEFTTLIGIMPLKYEIAIPSRIKLITIRGVAIIPTSKGFMPKKSGVLPIVLIRRLGKTEFVAAMREVPSAPRNIAHKTKFLRRKISSDNFSSMNLYLDG